MVARLFIFGSVQGVGYRQFVKSNAHRLGLNGWIKNLPDGSVEAVLQGEKETIEKMIELCEKGPWLAEVKDARVKWEEDEKQFENFMILHE